MKRRILVVAFSKQPGGAEKSAIKVAYSLMNSCFDFTKLATFKQSELDFYEVPQELPEVALFPNYNKLINSKLGNNIDQFWKELKGELTAQELLNKEKVIEKKSRIANLAAKTRKIILNAAGAAARIAGATMRRAKHYARFLKKTRPSSSTRKLRR